MKNLKNLLKQIPFIGSLFYQNAFNRDFKFWKDYITYFPPCFRLFKSFYNFFFHLLGFLYVAQGSTFILEPQAHQDLRYALVALVNIGGGLLIAAKSSEYLKTLKKGARFDH